MVGGAAAGDGWVGGGSGGGLAGSGAVGMVLFHLNNNMAKIKAGVKLRQ